MSRVLFLTRLLNRRLAAPTTTIRVDVCPPDIVPARDGSWATSLRRAFGNDADRADPGTPLDRARIEFVEALEGLPAVDADDLLCRAQHARSLRELWHLRSELYTLIARRMSQNEADTRLSRVNRHFPIRTSQRGGFATI
jgi:hypothetical protein